MTKVVYVDMVGDLFHYGHINMLKNAKKEGNLLYVGVHSDKDVESYKRTPILTMDERISVIKECKYVDKVIPNSPLIITKEFMEKYNIDLVCHSHTEEEDSNYNITLGYPKSIGKFKRLEYTDDISTTQIIKRIKDKHTTD